MARATTPGLGNEGPSLRPSLLLTTMCVSACWAAPSWTPTRFLRSYIWHCIGIPIIASIFMILHFWRVRKDGGISGPAAVVLDSEVKEAKK